MNLEARKLSISNLMCFLADTIYQPMTKNEFNRRINQSMEDSKKGNLISNDELISEIERWD